MANDDEDNSSVKRWRERVAGAGHAIQAEKPQAVIDALEDVLAKVATT